MAAPTKREILDFSPINSGAKEELPAFRRDDFGGLEKDVGTGLVVSVTGLRRVGKSTMVKQLLGRNSFYFSFDEKRHANPETLKRVVEVFCEEGERPLIALDEVFRVEDWAGVIKRYHDQKKARFIVTGSSSTMIRKGVESLGGRMLERHLPPLRFGEYLGLSGKKPECLPFEKIFRSKRHDEELSGFLRKGSFPEAIAMDGAEAQRYIRASTAEKIVFDDIPAIFRVEYPSKLYDLFRLCATNSANLFTEVNFAEALQISRHAVSDYMLYLQRAYLVDVAYAFGSAQKALRKQKKVYAACASLYNAVAENPTAGQAAETAVHDKLAPKMPSFSYDARKREVDFVCDYPVEVKYQSAITSQDTANILEFMRRHRKDFGVVVTKGLFDEKRYGGMRLLFLPLDVFLLARL
jgi:predicted AAA+ superfamily ATPase